MAQYRVGDRLLLAPFDGLPAQRCEVLEVTVDQHHESWGLRLVWYTVCVDEADREVGDDDGLAEGVTEDMVDKVLAVSPLTGEDV